MNYRNCWLLSLALLLSLASNAQSVVNSSGNSLSGGGITLEYSIGEISIATLSSAHNYVTQGLLQPVIKENTPAACPRMQGELKLYPNPSRGQVRLVGIQDWITGYMVYSADGKLVTASPYFQQTISVSALAAGVYFIKLTPDCNGQFKILKLVKQ